MKFATVVLMLLASGCATRSSGGSYCDVAAYLRPTLADVACMSDELVLQIDAERTKYRELCDE